MKTIIINILLLFVGIQAHGNGVYNPEVGLSARSNNITDPLDSIIKPPIKVSLIIPDTLYRSMLDVPIYLKIENLTLRPLTISDPTDHAAYLQLMKDGLYVSAGVRVRAYIRYTTIQIGAFGVLLIDLTKPWKLDELFFLGPNPVGEYSISCTYWYSRVKKKKKVVYDRMIETKPKTFYIK